MLRVWTKNRNHRKVKRLLQVPEWLKRQVGHKSHESSKINGIHW